MWACSPIERTHLNQLIYLCLCSLSLFSNRTPTVLMTFRSSSLPMTLPLPRSTHALSCLPSLHDLQVTGEDGDIDGFRRAPFLPSSLPPSLLLSRPLCHQRGGLWLPRSHAIPPYIGSRPPWNRKRGRRRWLQ